jgi:5-methylthioadenosine/S-adenosylhomocysteine deaminase
LRPEVQLVHCVQLGADDIDAIAQSGAGVAHCPKSNAKLAVGAAPIRELLDAGVPTGLGTDSLMSNNRVDMFEEMRMAAFLNSLRGKPPIQPRRLLRMAMLDGARTLGRDGECGSLEPGKRADFVVVSLDGAHFAPLSDVEAALVYCGCAADVRALHIGGREVDAGAERLDGAREACARALPRIIAQAGQRPRPAASAGAQSSE